ncbi:MAG: hypothetical protein DME00_02000, partial [Candidatus Rokuibacteriota bacterium]
MIRRSPLASVAPLAFFIFIATAGALLLTFTTGSAQPAVAQDAAARVPRVTLGSDSRSGHRYIRISGSSGAPVYPTVDLACDGKRWTLALTRSEDGAVYEISRANVELMLS